MSPPPRRRSYSIITKSVDMHITLSRLKIVLGVAAAVLFAACHNMNAFDFSRQNGVEAEGSWGVPLVNAEYSIGDILIMTEEIEYLHINDNGTMEVHYEYELDSVVTAEHYLDLFQQRTFSKNGSATLSGSSLPTPSGYELQLVDDTLSVELPTDEVVLYSASLKSGLVDIHIVYNLMQPVMVNIICPQLTNASGQVFHVSESCSSGNFYSTIDFGGYTLNVPGDNTLEFYIGLSTITSGNPFPETLTFDYSVTLRQVRFTRVEGNFVTVDLPFDEEWDFDLSFLREHIAGSMQLHNPQVVLEVLNSFPVDADIVLNEASLTGEGVSSSIISSNEAHITIPASTSGFEPENLPLANHILLSPNFSSFRLRGDASVNTPGLNTSNHLVFTDDQLISLRILVKLPLQLSVNNVTFRDTFDFSTGFEIPDEPAFSNLALRLGLINGLPFTFGVQVYFYDSQTQTVKDSLFTNPQPVHAAVMGEPRLTELFATKEDLYAVQQLLNCDRIILYASLTTDNMTAIVNIKQTLGVQLSASFNLDVNEFLLTEH